MSSPARSDATMVPHFEFVCRDFSAQWRKAVKHLVKLLHPPTAGGGPRARKSSSKSTKSVDGVEEATAKVEAAAVAEPATGRLLDLGGSA